MGKIQQLATSYVYVSTCAAATTGTMGANKSMFSTTNANAVVGVFKTTDLTKTTITDYKSVVELRYSPR